MPKTKSDMMARLRERRASEGKKRLEIWAKPENHDTIRDFAAKLENDDEPDESER